jgi:hypothetical protein
LKTKKNAGCLYAAVKTTVVYEAHRILTTRTVLLLSLFERKVLRCIFGAKQENGTWQKRYNYELYETFEEPNVVTYIKVKRLAWAGNLVHMNNDRTIKKIFNTKADGVRSVGRPRLRWEGGVDQDIRILGVKNWKKVTLNRDEWAKLLKKARAHLGLSSQ